MELKPCPFCGREPDTSDVGISFQVYCGYCSTAVTLEDKEEAIEKWNNRPQNQKLIEALGEIVAWGQATSNAMGHANEPVDIAQQALDEVDTE